jgi:hypothetical protein
VTWYRLQIKLILLKKKKMEGLWVRARGLLMPLDSLWELWNGKPWEPWMMDLGLQM